jgi:hypothetical protein
VAVDSLKSLEYAVQMVEPVKADLEAHVRLWIKKNKKENSRLEFKLKVDLGTPGAKAEFIRDVHRSSQFGGRKPFFQPPFSQEADLHRRLRWINCTCLIIKNNPRFYLTRQVN